MEVQGRFLRYGDSATGIFAKAWKNEIFFKDEYLDVSERSLTIMTRRTKMRRERTRPPGRKNEDGKDAGGNYHFNHYQ